jgi:hypothetical protein
MTFWIIVFGIPNSKLRQAIDFSGLRTQDCLMHSSFSSDVPGRPEGICFTTLLISLNCFSHCFRALSSDAFSPGCNLHYLHCTVTTDFISPYHKTNWAFWCIEHLSPYTDLHWEVKLAWLEKSDGCPCAQVVLIGQPTKASQRHLLPTIDLAYPKVAFFFCILKFESFRYVSDRFL